MDKFTIKEIIESSLKVQLQMLMDLKKYTAEIIFDGFDNLTSVGRHKIVYKHWMNIKSGELCN